jgi:hypothetical protein
MKSILKIAATGLMVISIASCTKSPDNTVTTGIALSISGITTSPASTGMGMKSAAIATTGFTFAEALIGIKEIELKRKEEHLHDTLTPRDTVHGEFHFKGKYLIDLLAGTSTPDLGLASFVPGTYNKFESSTARLIDGGKSISVKGSYTDLSSKVFNFDFSTRGMFEFEFESDSGFVLTEGNILQMVVNVNLPALLANIDFSTATADANNVIVINETTNIELFKRIKHNLRRMGEMHEDHHHDKDKHMNGQ